MWSARVRDEEMVEVGEREEVASFMRVPRISMGAEADSSSSPKEGDCAGGGGRWRGGGGK